VRKGTK